MCNNETKVEEAPLLQKAPAVDEPPPSLEHSQSGSVIETDTKSGISLTVFRKWAEIEAACF